MKTVRTNICGTWPMLVNVGTRKGGSNFPGRQAGCWGVFFNVWQLRYRPVEVDPFHQEGTWVRRKPFRLPLCILD